MSTLHEIFTMWGFSELVVRKTKHGVSVGYRWGNYRSSVNGTNNRELMEKMFLRLAGYKARTAGLPEESGVIAAQAIIDRMLQKYPENR